MKKIIVNSLSFEKLKELILKGYFKKKVIFNPINANTLYYYKNNQFFRDLFSKENHFKLIDGFTVSLFSRGKRLRGPEFTRKLLNDIDLLKNKKHFFIGLEKKDLDLLVKKCPLLKRKNLFSYNPQYIQDIIFPEEERDKIIKLVNKQKIDYLWIGVGSPKQDILSSQIYDKVKVKFIMSIGAALDFVAEKKKEAPRLVQKLGLEWLFRLITDFQYSKKKVWRSLIGTSHMFGRFNKKTY